MLNAQATWRASRKMVVLVNTLSVRGMLPFCLENITAINSLIDCILLRSYSYRDCCRCQCKFASSILWGMAERYDSCIHNLFHIDLGSSNCWLFTDCRSPLNPPGEWSRRPQVTLQFPGSFYQDKSLCIHEILLLLWLFVFVLFLSLYMSFFCE